MNEGQALWIALTASVVAIICGVVFSLQIIKESDGNDGMREIAGAIQEGAQAYLTRQYSTTVSYTHLTLPTICSV